MPPSTQKTDRRAILASTASLGSALLAGCLDGAGRSRHTDVDRMDDFHLENRTGGQRVFEFELRRRDPTEPVVEGRYEVPGGAAAVFSEVGEESADYDVYAALDDGRELEAEWSVGDCENVYEGNRDGGVVLAPEGTLEYRENNCDEHHLGYDVRERPADRYRATPTPGE